MVVGKTKLQKGHLFPRIMVEWKMAGRQATHLPHNIFRFQVFVGYLFPSTKVGTFFVRRCYLSYFVPMNKIPSKYHMPSKPNNLHFLGVMNGYDMTHILEGLKTLHSSHGLVVVGVSGLSCPLQSLMYGVLSWNSSWKKTRLTGQIWWEGSQKWCFFWVKVRSFL